MDNTSRSILSTLNDRRRVPQPAGSPLGQQQAWKRWVSSATTAAVRALRQLPPGRWLHRRLRRSLAFSPVEIELHRGGEGLHGLKIAYLSDVHAGCFMDEKDLEEIFELLAACEPDLICLGGDLIEHRAEDILLFRKALSLVSPPLGVFAVPGNHEYHAEPDLQRWRGFLQELGVEVLINRGVRVLRNGSGIWIAGVDDLTHGVPDLEAALAGYSDEEPVLLLAHHPDFFYEASDIGVDLTLSGHTHAGQVALLGWVPFKHTRLGFLEGQFEENEAKLFVGHGAGVTLFPLRIRATAEIPLISLRLRD